MATTIVAALFAPRTKQIHIAHVGDSRCYRLRHGRLELLTLDHTIANEILERRPETPDDVLERLPRNSVTSALGMDMEFRVPVRSLDLVAGDRFLLCTDGLTTAISTTIIWNALREPEPAGAIASELLSHAIAARSHDNISLLVVDCREQMIDEKLETRRYNEVPLRAPSAPEIEPDDGPSSAELIGPEIMAPGYAEAVEDWGGDSEMPTAVLSEAKERELFHDAQKEAPDPSYLLEQIRSLSDTPESADGPPPSGDIEVLDGDPLDIESLLSSDLESEIESDLESDPELEMLPPEEEKTK